MAEAGDRMVSVEDQVAAPRAVAGDELRDGFLDGVQALTLNLVRVRGSSLWLGPVELLRFGRPAVGPARVTWPIEGGLLAKAPGGHFEIESSGGTLVARIERYRPWLPRPIYAVTQLPIHHLVMRMHLLRARGRRPAAGEPAEPARRLAAGAIDVAVCWGLASFGARRYRMVSFIGLAAGYHVACWSLSGWTLGGLVMSQRVVAVDGSRPRLGQSMLRLLTLPLAAARMRAVHDEIAGTDVISG